MFRKIRDLLGLIPFLNLKRSNRAHASFRVSNLEDSLAFYQKLGFRQLTTSRKAEVVLLRNQRGDELNLTPSTSHSHHPSPLSTSAMSVRVKNLDREISELEEWYPKPEIVQDSVTRNVKILDPDSNVIEYFEIISPEQRAKKKIYHLATETELVEGLTNDYYLPPQSERRFVHCRAHSSLISLAWKQIATDLPSPPLLIELDRKNLSIEESWLDVDMDAPAAGKISTYPHVHSPIPRNAIVGVGQSNIIDGEFGWPERFVPISAVLA